MIKTIKGAKRSSRYNEQKLFVFEKELDIMTE